MVDRTMPRFQEVVLPILRDGLGDDVMVASWEPAVGDRKYPLVCVYRVGGNANKDRRLFDQPIISLETQSEAGLVEAENTYLDALTVLQDAVDNQTIVDAGYIHSLRDSEGMVLTPSDTQNTWMVQGIITLGIRPKTKREFNFGYE